MKMLLVALLSYISLQSHQALADKGKIDYCVCFQNNGESELVNFKRNASGQIQGVSVSSTGKDALKYSVKSTQTGSAEVILIAKQAATNREKNLIIYRDKKGSLVSMSLQIANNVNNCSGSATGAKSYCAANDTSIVELAK